MSDFPEKAEDKVNTLAIVAIGLATTAILWASVVALQAYFQNTQGDIAAERAAQGLTSSIRDLDARQRADLGKLEYADANKGTLKHLPIELAKAAVLRAAADNSSMIPALGELNVPTVPAIPGKAADGAKVEAPAVEEPAEACDEVTCMVTPETPCCQALLGGAAVDPAAPAPAPVEAAPAAGATP